MPGLLLAYLSVRTVKDEGLLVERNLEGNYLAFADVLNRLIIRSSQAQLDQAEWILRQTTSSNSPDSLMILGAGLLEVPMVQSLVVLRSGRQILPPPIVDLPSDEAPALSPAAAALLQKIRLAYRFGRDDEVVHGVRAILALPDSSLRPPQALELRFGLRLMELKSLARSWHTLEAMSRIRPLILALLGDPAPLSPQRRGFYLHEAIGTLTSLEDLPLEDRDWLFHLHQRLDIYLANAEYIADYWPDAAREAYALPPEDTSGLSVRFLDNQPYLVVGYPWLDQETRIVAKLNQKAIIEAVDNEIFEDRKAAAREIDFRIIDAGENTLLSSDSSIDRDVAVERPIGEGFPQWRLLIYKKRDGEIAALGRRRSALQWLLLLVSCGGMLLGSAAVVMAVRRERKTVRIKTNFLSAVSHELKTPLTAIRMFSDILESGRQKEEEKRIRYARLIGEEARRLQGMIEGILSLGRLEEGRTRLQLDDIRLGEIVREVAALMSGAFVKAEIELVLQIDETPTLVGDRDAVRSVVQNLLENALKYSEAGGQVKAIVERQGAHIALHVIDEGIGIAKEDQKRIFDTFWRAGDELTRRTRGSGLGLAIVKQIADAHKAKIEVESSPGKGTRMTLIFPSEEVGHA